MVQNKLLRIYVQLSILSVINNNYAEFARIVENWQAWLNWFSLT
ncbi:hypothetical protein [Dolichospermum circinale]|nr:hypothetical protein [Dolichospermum circinale]MDB9457480.1 hypothetical protein [Dolichospermum circinale CS-545/17]